MNDGLADLPMKRTGMRATEILWYCICLAIVVVSSLQNILFPFVADQAVAMAGAKTIAAGGTLYVDFWDNKMPGLFWFYYVAGELFAYSEIGVHILDLIWMTSFAIVIMVCLRRYYHYPWLSAVAAVAVVAVYNVSVESFSLTQLEVLVGFPIFLSAWYAAQIPQPNGLRQRAAFISGLCAGVTVVFKLVFAPLFVVFWLIVSARLLRDNHPLRAIVRAVWLPLSVGVGVILVALALKFWMDGALDELLWTAFIYPPQALEHAPAASHFRLADGLRYFTSYYMAWLAFLLVALYRWWRGDRDLFSSLMIAWLCVGAILIYIQHFSWWLYHFLTLFPPMGILAVRGINDATTMIVSAGGKLRSYAMLITLLFAFSPVGALAVPAGQKLVPYYKFFVERGGGVAGFQNGINNDYGKIKRSVRFLNDPTAEPGKIYVFGDPLYYHLSGRTSALPIIGWPWAYFLQEQWERVPAQLVAAKPVYIYIDGLNRRLMIRRGGGVWDVISERYLQLIEDHKGAWFILKPQYR